MANDKQVQQLIDKIKHYLITVMGKKVSECSQFELFQALSYSLREEIMINWSATHRTWQNSRKKLFYLSMEYLPGRFLANNLSNLNAHSLINQVLEKLGRSKEDIVLLEPDPGLGNGGLGRLASCFLDSLATQHYPALAYGLRYQYGIFEQQIWDGIQIERPDCWLLIENPWELRRDQYAQMVKFGGEIKKVANIQGEDISELINFEEVRALPFDYPIIGYNVQNAYSVVTLRLWSTKESPLNFHLQRYNAGHIGQAAENTALTDVLYPNDHHETGKRIRLKQEFLLVSASLLDIVTKAVKQGHSLEEFEETIKIQINDTHPALAVAELARLFLTHYHCSWNRSWEAVQKVLNFTNHSILTEALEEWDQHQMATLLPRQYRIIERINFEFCNNVRRQHPDNEGMIRRVSIIERGRVRMAHLAVLGSRRVNGVAELHTQIIKNQLFKDFNEFFPEKIVNVTNGVTQRHWLLHANPLLAQFYNNWIGNQWASDFSTVIRFKEHASNPLAKKELSEIKRLNKERLIAFLENKKIPKDTLGNFSSKNFSSFLENLHIDALFDVQVKRIHEYKRQLLNLLHLIGCYLELKKDIDSHKIFRVAIFAGKAASGYHLAKEIIRLIFCVSRRVNQDKDLKGKLKIFFIENYDVSHAENIIPAADLSEQISTAGFEASGTGNMKLTINGALTIGTEDGANIEMRRAVGDSYWPFSFGESAGSLRELKKKGWYRPEEIISKNSLLRSIIDSLKNGDFAENQSEHQSFNLIYDALMWGVHGKDADDFAVLKDFESYYNTQKRVEDYYLNPEKWNETVLHNMAAMGHFSIDRTIQEYATKIWQIEPMPLDMNILKEVKEEFSEHDRCRIW